MTVVCGDLRLAANDKNAVANPTLLVEVTSNSTEDYDRGEKLNHYKQCESLKVVLFVSHRRPQVTVVARSEAGWEQREYRIRSGNRVVTACVGLSQARAHGRAKEEADARGARGMGEASRAVA